MAEESQNGHREEWRLDLDALAPVRAGVVTIAKQDYDVTHFLDVPVEQVMRAMRLEDTTGEDESLEAFAARSVEVAKIFAPSIPDDVFRGLSTHRLRVLVKRVMTVSEVPSADSPPDVGPESRSPSSSTPSGTPAAETSPPS